LFHITQVFTKLRKVFFIKKENGLILFFIKKDFCNMLAHWLLLAIFVFENGDNDFSHINQVALA